MNADGTGIMLLTVTLPDETTRSATADLVIAQTEEIHGIMSRQEFVDEQREPSLVLGNGVFVTQDDTRREDEREK
ncbi:MAG TPA: hypothetical protein VK638_12740 [Edaphobacter sp.]|nr:hypothetical protein [Edaphobacter sp.]